VAGNEMGKQIYHRRWMGRLRWEVAGNEMGRRIDHRRWDVQDGKWQVMRWEHEFTTGDGTSKMGSGR